MTVIQKTIIKRLESCAGSSEKSFDIGQVAGDIGIGRDQVLRELRALCGSGMLSIENGYIVDTTDSIQVKQIVIIGRAHEKSYKLPFEEKSEQPTEMTREERGFEEVTTEYGRVVRAGVVYKDVVIGEDPTRIAILSVGVKHVDGGISEWLIEDREFTASGNRSAVESAWDYFDQQWEYIEGYLDREDVGLETIEDKDGRVIEATVTLDTVRTEDGVEVEGDQARLVVRDLMGEEESAILNEQTFLPTETQLAKDLAWAAWDEMKKDLLPAPEKLEYTEIEVQPELDLDEAEADTAPVTEEDDEPHDGEGGEWPAGPFEKQIHVRGIRFFAKVKRNKTGDRIRILQETCEPLAVFPYAETVPARARLYNDPYALSDHLTRLIENLLGVDDDEAEESDE